MRRVKHREGHRRRNTAHLIPRAYGQNAFMFPRVDRDLKQKRYSFSPPRYEMLQTVPHDKWLAHETEINFNESQPFRSHEFSHVHAVQGKVWQNVQIWHPRVPGGASVLQRVQESSQVLSCARRTEFISPRPS